MIYIMYGITFAEWQYCFLLLPIILGLFFLVWYRYVRIKKTIVILTQNRQKLLLSNFSFVRQRLKIFCMLVTLLSLFAALLRPQWGEKKDVVVQEGRDLFIGLDISRSMLATDCQPNRLQYAKHKIKRLLRALGSERVGLLLFSGAAFIQCPLTSDYAAFSLFLDSVDVETISSGTTALDQAIQKVIDTFATMEGKKNKLLVLFTDGEDFSSNLHMVKTAAHKAGLSIFTVGVGTKEGAPIPLYDVQGKQIGHQKDLQGKVVISRLNEGILRGISSDVGGAYVGTTPDDTDISTIVQQVKRFERERSEEKEVSRLQERYPYFALVSFIFCALEWIL